MDEAQVEGALNVVIATELVAREKATGPGRHRPGNLTPDPVAFGLRLALGMTHGLERIEHWQEVFDWCIRERCAPLVWLRSGERIVELAPREVSTAWRAVFVANVLRIRELIGATADAAGAAAAADIHPVILKGPPLAQRLYGDVAARISSDLDWYVPARDRGRLRELLIRTGWRPIEGDVTGEECFERAGQRAQLYLEVHSSLMHSRLTHLVPPAPAHKNIEIEGYLMRVHDGPLVPGYLSAHLATHRFPPLAWLVDLATLWDGLGRAARVDARHAAAEAGLERYLTWALGRTELARAAAFGDQTALLRLGIHDDGRREAHPVWRHIALAPNIPVAFRVARGWLYPEWARADGIGIVSAILRRVARHWRSALFGREPASAHARRHPPAQASKTTLPEAMAIDTSSAVDRDTRTFSAVRNLLASGEEVWLVVTGRSMVPTLRAGDRVLLAPAPRRPRRGAVAFADYQGRAVLHRILMVRDDEIVTASEASLFADPRVQGAAVLAIALAVHSGGRVTALELTLRFGGAALARYVLSECRWRVRRLWRRIRYHRALSARARARREVA